MQPLVSIIIPVYNAEKYLTETLRSALDQTWENKEIIVVDDGSTDGSMAIAEQHRKGGVKIFCQENKGASAARNLGLAHAQGQYIQFLDADDLLSRNKIEAQISILKDFPEYLGLCPTVHFNDGNDHLMTEVDYEWFSEGSDNPVDFLIRLYGEELIGLGSGGMIQPNAWLTPRKLIDKAGLWNEMRSPDDDGEFFNRVILASKGLKYSREAVNYYRKFENADSWSARRTYEACNSLLQTTKLKADNLLKATTDSLAKRALSRLFFENAFAFYPYYRELSKEAEQQAIALNSSHQFNPFKHGLKKKLTALFGWKIVRYIQFINAKLKRR